MGVKKIVLTGGPCAGKTTLLTKIQETFSEQGYTVLVVPEAATELISSGLCPGTEAVSMEKFQEFVVRRQLDTEKNYDLAAGEMVKNGGEVLIVCDRGIMDGQGYVSENNFDHVLDLFGLTRSDAFARYDGVIHLVTAAQGAEYAYTTSNNAARRETAEQARELDVKTQMAWVGHSHLRVIGNETDFQTKIYRALRAITDILGKPVPIEVEKKFLIERPDNKTLKELNAAESTLVQIYLKANGNTERRIRIRRFKNGCSYYYTEKKPCSTGGRIERERLITANEYFALLCEADSSCSPIAKIRYCFVYKDQYFELDIYPDEHEQAILELELSDEANEITVPPNIKVIEDVTDNAAYCNRSIAKRRNRFPSNKIAAKAPDGIEKIKENNIAKTDT